MKFELHNAMLSATTTYLTTQIEPSTPPILAIIAGLLTPLAKDLGKYAIDRLLYIIRKRRAKINKGEPMPPEQTENDKTNTNEQNPTV